jgi:hypothetical protein
MSERGLPQAGRTVEEHVVQGFLPGQRGLDVNGKVCHYLFLADELF